MPLKGSGTLVNMAAVVAGAAVGAPIGRFIPERMRKAAMGALGLAILYLGLRMALNPSGPAQPGAQPPAPNLFVLIGGLAAGSLLGEGLRIEERLDRFARGLQARVAGLAGAQAPGSRGLAEGFVTASLLYCVGAMAVIGAINDATGQPQVLYVKAMLDGFSAMLLASTLGAGVGLSALSLLFYQGGITLAALWVSPFLTPPVLTTLTASGGLLIAAIGLDLAGMRRLPVGNMLPGVFLAAILAYFVG
jgi:uncharacterized membrane protein YqgA involved in biofilm formation